MLKQLHNEARFTLTITTTSPVLIRSGFPTLTGPDMTPVLTFRNNEWQVYFPGSSLKGVVRSHLEKICRTLRHDPAVVCNPFKKLVDAAKVDDGRLVCPDYADVFCGDKFERRTGGDLQLLQPRSRWRHDKEHELTTAQAYAESCPICRLFGSTEFIGRVSIGDAYLADGENARPTELRDGVGIDRLTGGAFSRALFNLEAVSSGVTFKSSIHVRNFEDWQLGMLLTIVQDMADGLVRIGSGRSRGLGGITARVDEVTIGYLGLPLAKPADEVWGLGKFLGEATAYGTNPDDVIRVAVAPEERNRGIRRESIFRGDSLASLTDAASGAFVARIGAWSIPDRMTFAALGYHS